MDRMQVDQAIAVTDSLVFMAWLKCLHIFNCWSHILQMRNMQLTIKNNSRSVCSLPSYYKLPASLIVYVAIQ